MQHPILITEEVLYSRADYADSRGLIPELLFRLIAASIKNPNELRLPFGGSIGQPGWDVIVDSPYAFEPYIPQGKSFWEIGTCADPGRKATEDFNKRTEETSETKRKSSTFVFVTPRSASSGWDHNKQRKWIDKRLRSTDWKDIRVIDATKLVQWLYLFPEIELWLLSEFGIPNKGLSSPHLHWEKLKLYGSPPELSPKLFLIGRELAIQQVLRVFRGEIRELLLKTQYPGEGVDFVSAILASLDLDKKDAFTGRCLIIDDPETWKAMCTLKEPHVFIANSSLDCLGNDANLILLAMSKGHRVIFAGTPIGGEHVNSVYLPAVKPYDIEEMLISCGYAPEKARKVSKQCGSGGITALKRLLLGIPVSPGWASTDISSELLIAVLIGQWDGNSVGDCESIEKICGEIYGEWIKKIRPMTLRSDPPLIQRNEKWRFVSRYEGWQSLGPSISNDDLERFQKQALIVLREKDPKFSLPPEEWWRAAIYDKKPIYSSIIREGFAETLALLGTYPNALTSCSPGKAKSIAAITVREILKETDWVHWASLNDILPLLAEAAPEQFLDAVEKALKDPDKTFENLFLREGKGPLGGGNYMTGVLWALETLAWHKDYLTRVTVLLGHLAEIDHGGNWANRPLDSLIKIYLPWRSQTCAPIEIRKVALEVLIRECPEIAWKLLLALLPSPHQTTFGCRKPSWREFIPVDFSEDVLIDECYEQEIIYMNLAVQCAMTDLIKLLGIIGILGNLYPAARSEILEYLSSEKILNLPEQKKVTLWEALIDLITKHRRFADAVWAMPSEQVDKIEEVSERLKPSDPELIHRRLFCQHKFELFEEKGNYEEQRQQLSERRIKAIKEILESSGIKGTLNFARSVTDTQHIGVVLGKIATDEYDLEILPSFLVYQEKNMESLACAYVISRFEENGWPWADGINMENWSEDQKAAFLAFLPFGREAWQRVKSLLGERETIYWKRTGARPYDLKEELPEAIELLLKHGRARTAIQCLGWMTHKKMPISIDLVYRALMSNLTSKEPDLSIDQHACTELIQWLQSNPEIDDDVLFEIEWNYLPLLDHNFGLAPKVLERSLAENPSFFCEVIRAIFRSSKEKEPLEEPSEKQKRIAKNAHELLYKWRTPPGSMRDGSFDIKSWIEEVKRSCEVSGHLEIALDQAGTALAHSPPDPSGLWIHKGAAEVLNEENHDVMRDGFRIGLFRQRGVFTWTAGDEEKKIAAAYREKADAVEKEGYFRLAASIREIAASYEHDAEREASRDPFDIWNR